MQSVAFLFTILFRRFIAVSRLPCKLHPTCHQMATVYRFQIHSVDELTVASAFECLVVDNVWAAMLATVANAINVLI